MPFIEAQTSIQAAYLAQRDHADTLEDFAFDLQDCWNRYYEQRLSATEAYYNAQPDGKPVWKLRRLRDAAYSRSEFGRVANSTIATEERAYEAQREMHEAVQALIAVLEP